MPRGDAPRKAWSDDNWSSHSIGCPPGEWAEWKAVAALLGKSVNGYLRQAVNEMAKFDRLNLAERESLAATISETSTQNETNAEC